jgi:hypothetical protein
LLRSHIIGSDDSTIVSNNKIRDFYTTQIPSSYGTGNIIQLVYNNKFIIDPEIKEINNDDFINLLSAILLEILFQLTKFGKNDALIKIGFFKDVEIDNWTEFTISIKLPPVILINYEEHFIIWEEISKKVKSRISLTNISDKYILEKYSDPVIILEEPQ